MGPSGRYSIARSALLSGYLGKSGHLPRLVEEAKEAKSVGSEFVTAKEIPADAELASTLLLLPRLAPLMTLMT